MKINDSAAYADISKINAAKEKLEESKKSLDRIRTVASSMEGKTGQAIDAKAAQLASMIEQLNGQLDSSVKVIRNTVERYHNEDHDAALSIAGGSGV